MDISVILAGIAMLIISVISYSRLGRNDNPEKGMTVIFFMIIAVILIILGIVSTFFGGA